MSELTVAVDIKHAFRSYIDAWNKGGARPSQPA